jgi:hypothetical protein
LGVWFGGFWGFGAWVRRSTDYPGETRARRFHRAGAD